MQGMKSMKEKSMVYEVQTVSVYNKEDLGSQGGHKSVGYGELYLKIFWTNFERVSQK